MRGGLCPLRPAGRIGHRAPASNRGSATSTPATLGIATGSRLERALYFEAPRGAGFAGDQPWRCLWRGSVQITMTRPCRRITRHLLQILLTLGLTFTVMPYSAVRADVPRARSHASGVRAWNPIMTVRLPLVTTGTRCDPIHHL
jgi:hypothetical protein